MQIGPAQPIEKSTTRMPSSGKPLGVCAVWPDETAPPARPDAAAASPIAGHLAAAPRRRAGQPLHRANGKAALARRSRSARSRRATASPRRATSSAISGTGTIGILRFSPSANHSARSLLQLRHEFCPRSLPCVQPVDAEEQRRVVAQLDQAEHLAERAPLRRRHRGDAEPAFFGLVDADRECRPEPVDADAAHDVAARERLEHDVFGDRDARFIDAELAGAAVAVMHAADHGRCRGNKSPQPAEDAGLEIRRMRRRASAGPISLTSPISARMVESVAAN